MKIDGIAGLDTEKTAADNPKKCKTDAPASVSYASKAEDEEGAAADNKSC